MEKLLAILNEIKEDADFVNCQNYLEEGYLDSLDIMTLVERLEECYNIEISGAEIVPENFRNLESILSIIARYD